MSVKKKYYTMNNQDFKSHLNQLKTSDNTLHIFRDMDTPYFFVNSLDMNQSILELNKLQLKLDNIYDSLSDIQKEMVKQSCLLDEIQSTNKTENVYSTRSDIFELFTEVKKISNKKIISIVNVYSSLQDVNTYTLEMLRYIYDQLMENAYESKEDVPDGIYFRKDTVHVSNGIKKVHQGFYPEDMIIQGMNEYIDFIQNNHIDEYLKLILSHFMIETIHPYYDGNGRYGRFLMSIDLYTMTKSIFSICLSTSINNKKKEYYKAFEVGRDIHEFGCINEYVSLMIDIFKAGLEDKIQDLSLKKDRLLNKEYILELTKSEKLIYDILYEASILTYFGISNEDIMEITGVSRRTLMSTLKKFRESNLIIDMKLGKTQYHKLKIKYMLIDD